MQNIIRYRQRMFAASKELSAVIPKLIKATEEQAGVEMLSRQELEAVKESVAKLLELQAISEQQTATVGAAIGHLMEQEEEMAHLATFAQYPEIAAQVSVSFIADIHRHVELPVYEQALGQLEDDRLLLLEAAMNRVINNKRK